MLYKYSPHLYTTTMMQSIHVYIQIIINVECNIKGANLFTTHKVLHNILTVNSLHSFCI